MTKTIQIALRNNYKEATIIISCLAILCFVLYIASLVGITITLSMERNITNQIMVAESRLISVQKDFLSKEENISIDVASRNGLSKISTVVFAKQQALASY